MFLFIFESIGTSELILIGIIALIFLGPRKLPDMARKAGKIMSEFRGTANEFKETWQREVNFEEEARLLNVQDIDTEVETSEPSIRQTGQPAAPEIKEVDPAQLEKLMASDNVSEAATPTQPADNDKQNWL